MANKTRMFPRKITPEGEAIFPWLNEPHTRFDSDGVYTVTLGLPADSEIFDQLGKIAEDFKAEEKPANAAFYHPIKIGVRDGLTGKIKHRDHDAPVEETEDVITDTKYLKFKTVAKLKDGTPKPLKLFDIHGHLLTHGEGMIYSGSRIRVSYRPMTYIAGNNCGITLLLDAVQVIELAQDRDSAGAYGFTEQDQPAEDNTDDSDASGDIPF